MDRGRVHANANATSQLRYFIYTAVQISVFTICYYVTDWIIKTRGIFLFFSGLLGFCICNALDFSFLFIHFFFHKLLYFVFHSFFIIFRWNLQKNSLFSEIYSQISVFTVLLLKFYILSITIFLL